jgi:hypothetical protein
MSIVAVPHYSYCLDAHWGWRCSRDASLPSGLRRWPSQRRRTIATVRTRQSDGSLAGSTNSPRPLNGEEVAVRRSNSVVLTVCLAPTLDEHSGTGGL